MKTQHKNNTGSSGAATKQHQQNGSSKPLNSNTAAAVISKADNKAETLEPERKPEPHAEPQNLTPREEIKVQEANAMDKILNDLDTLNTKREQRTQLLETLRKLKSFNPTITESGCTLWIKDKHNEFKTSATEPLKMMLSGYINIVELKLKEVESDITIIAQSLGA